MTSEVKARLVVVVCGGRHYTDRAFVYKTLNLLRAECRSLVIIEGGCKSGADAFAQAWAKSKRYTEPIELITEEVTKEAWIMHGHAAGPMHNRRMLEEYYPDLVIAFEGGRGTKSTIEIARELGIEVRQPKRQQ